MHTFRPFFVLIALLFVLGCEEGTQPVIESGDVLCADGIDNDNDGLVDCDDANCWLACGWPEFDGGTT